MIGGLLGLFVLAAVVTSGNSMTQILLEDESITFLTNDLIGKTLTIPKFPFDILQSCHVVLPSGAMVEAYPDNELQDPYISFLNAVEPYRSCAIGFLGAPTNYSGTYELYSLVQDRSNESLSLTRKKFHLNLVAVDPRKAKDKSIAFLKDGLIGKMLTIPKFPFDILQSCHVVLPSGSMVEVYPDNELQGPYISFLNAVEPYRSCAIGFLGAPTNYSGTYELYSLVQDRSNESLSLTRKKFHLNLVAIGQRKAKV